jgi:hypothetical protein
MTGPARLAGRALQFVLVAELMKRPDMTVAEMTLWSTATVTS